MLTECLCPGALGDGDEGGPAEQQDCDSHSHWGGHRLLKDGRCRLELVHAAQQESQLHI